MTTATIGSTVAVPTSKGKLWTARIMGGLVIAFMLMDSIFKLIPNDMVTAGTVELGYQAHHIPVMGVLGFISVLLFAIPRTQILGAILLTGYFGGAIATHLRLDNPLFSHLLFPVYLAVLAWGSLWLKNETLRKLIAGKK
ncbi:DoxX family protein [Fulvivirgaceae bacterium PWU4]|uniref:DoxX family protein n=1 Tax=Chryseosolibacter histidini TaxID=2782349 RepID=A0AAP2DLC1_9BACT|nr:DoxX family protein [Chryseosolibacter histidini]MBT1696029.1 DoxX family protein [Chryseosolibacter histidini]